MGINGSPALENQWISGVDSSADVPPELDRAVQQHEDVDIAVFMGIAASLGTVEHHPAQPLAERRLQPLLDFRQQFRDTMRVTFSTKIVEQFTPPCKPVW